MELPRQGGCEIKPEPVHVHLQHPVTEGIHDELKHMRVPHVQAVSGPCIVHVVAGVVLHQAVVGGVVDSLDREHRPEVVPLSRMIVNYIQDHLQTRFVQVLDHLLELLHLMAGLPPAHIPVMRGEIPDGIVPPVIAESPLHQVGVVNELMYWKKLHRGYPQSSEVVDGNRVGEPGVCAANLRRDLRMTRCKTLDMHLVDHGFVQRPAGRLIVPPVKIGADHQRLGNKRGAVLLVD